MRRRRGLLRHLPWALALFVPLVAVAVLGALELRRQGARLADAVQQQTATFLAAARLHFEERIRDSAQSALARVQIAAPDLVAETRKAMDEGERVLDLFLLDTNDHLVHPRLAMARESAMPFLSPTTSEEVRFAEYLLQLGGTGELQRAKQILTRYLQRRPMQQPERARAAFRLGTVLRRLGDRHGAEGAYLDARLAAAQTEASPIGIELLTRVAIAEMQQRPDELLALARGISRNEWFAVPDELAGAVFVRVLQALPLDPSGEAATSLAGAELAAMRAQENARRVSRRLAVEYNRFAAPALERALADEPSEPVLRSIGSGSECALLALRRTTTVEQSVAGRKVRWLGLRLDLPGLVNEVMDAFLTPRREGCRLVVLDPEGVPILDDGGGVGAGGPEVPTLAGLILRAVPVDPETTLHDEQAALRNRVLILAAVLAVALGGGFLLVRSVARETELATLKMVFVSRMSHELKTPLALIKMYGETLALGRVKDEDQARGFAGIVAREADRLNDQIERILSFAQQVSGTLRYTPQKVDLGAAVANVVEEYRDHVHRSGCVLDARIDPTAAAPSAFVDPHALHLAVISLIENAVKYTPKNQADRTVVVDVGSEGGFAHVAVRDHGIGIPEGERRRVFDPFYRASNAGEVRGAGLGLGQVRHFAQAHGGDVTVAAAVGGGTVVRLRIPLIPAADDPTTP
jgi:signal transduction histidine kinase